MTANGSALLRYATIIFAQKLTQVIKSNTAGFLRIQRYNRKILKRILKKDHWNKLGFIKKDFTIEDVKCHCSLSADFKNGDKNVKTFLKGEQILLISGKFDRKINLSFFYSNKMQHLLNASKA